MKIVSVLRTGPEYQAEHAQLLHAQLPDDAVCMTNLPDIKGVTTVPLHDSDLIGWWAKMELFNPDGPLGPHDLFYLDIDTVILGDIRPIIEQAQHLREMVMLSDFFNPQHPASGVMYIPWRMKRRVWDAWNRNPYWHMVKHRPAGRVGDQGFIADNVPHIRRWDEICPRKIVSYKKHIAAPGQLGYIEGKSIGNGEVPPEAVIVCYHGNPRPWNLEQLCKPSSSDTKAGSNGSGNSKQQSQVPQQLSIAAGKGRSNPTSKRSKSRSR